jgi:hypothetical protein
MLFIGIVALALSLAGPATASASCIEFATSWAQHHVRSPNSTVTTATQFLRSAIDVPTTATDLFWMGSGNEPKPNEFFNFVACLATSNVS